MLTRRRLSLELVLLGVLLAPCPGWAQPTVAPPALDLARWEDAIRAFEEADRRTPPPQDGLLLVGSSSIRLWTSAAEDFPRVPVINRGFGGSQVREVVAFADRIVIPYRPRVVLFYCGSNDVFSGRTVPEVVADTKAFIARVHAALPKARVIYISTAPNPARWHLKDAWIDLNRRMEALAAADSRVTFVDVWPEMLDWSGQPRPELFVEDRLHMNERGYAIWARILRPVVEREFAAIPTTSTDVTAAAPDGRRSGSRR
jgi:lysophospholipase L1-like esterase